MLGLSTSQGHPRTQLPVDCGPWRLLAGAGWSSYGQGIVQYGKEVKADLVILGTRGQTSLRYIPLRSTAERLLLEVPCSVLTVRPPNREAVLPIP